MTFSLEQLKSAAVVTFNRWDAIYDQCLVRQNEAIADVKKSHSTLPDHFWQETHNARIRREASKLLLEIVREIEKEEEEKRKIVENENTYQQDENSYQKEPD